MPHRYYGPKDTPLAEVKVGELKDWLSRRNKTPLGIMHAASRMRQLWFYKWVQPRNATGACWAQVCVVTSLLFYVTSYRYQSKFTFRSRLSIARDSRLLETFDCSRCSIVEILDCSSISNR